MSSFDPAFEFFRVAQRRNVKRTDHSKRFKAFRNYMLEDRSGASHNDLGDFVIQFVCHPNFEQNMITITYYHFHSNEHNFEKLDIPDGYKRANAYENYVTGQGEGHGKGLYYELNLYTPSGYSSHHNSRVKGVNYPRDDSHDIKHGSPKGKHWLE